MIGTDKSILNPDSAFSLRVKDYARQVRELHIISIIHFDKTKPFVIPEIAKNVHISVINNFNKLIAIYVFKLRLFFLLRAMGQNREERKDILVTVQEPFFIGFITMLVAKFMGVKFQSQIHIDFFNPYYKSESLRQRIEAMIAPFVLRNSDGIRVVSKKILNYCVQNLGIDEQKVKLAPVSVNPERVRNFPISIDLKKKYPQFSQIILMVSRIVKQKNIPLAINVFKNIVDKNKGVGMVIVGSGNQETIVSKMISLNNLENNVIIMPWSDAVPSLMKTADLFLISSDYEGWAMTAVEASLCGLPVIMTDVGCAGEYIIDGVNGRVVGIRDSEGMENAISELLNSHELMNRMSIKTKEISTRIEDLSGFAKKVANEWQKVIANGRQK